MQLSNLQTFLAIVETGNLNRAADLLHVTQSTVNARLNGLEQELGQSLFHRRKSGAELTAAGFRFERYAQLMTDLWRQARQETALPQSVGTVCNIACHPDLWPGPGKEIFNRIREAGESVAVSAWPAGQSDLDRWMVNGLVDMTLSFTPTYQRDWVAHRLESEQLVQVSSVARKRVRWDPRYVYVDCGDGFRRDHAAAYPDGDTPTTTLGSTVWALDYLLEHGGSAYLPLTLVQPYLEKGRLHEVIGSARFKRPVYLLVNQSSAQGWPWFDSIKSLLRDG